MQTPLVSIFKPFFYAILLGFCCDCSAKCHRQSKELLVTICPRWLFAPSEITFLSSLPFWRTSQDIDNLVVLILPCYPQHWLYIYTFNCVHIWYFIFKTSYKQQIAVKKMLIIGEGFCPIHMHGSGLFVLFNFYFYL